MSNNSQRNQNPYRRSTADDLANPAPPQPKSLVSSVNTRFRAHGFVDDDAPVVDPWVANQGRELFPNHTSRQPTGRTPDSVNKTGSNTSDRLPHVDSESNHARPNHSETPETNDTSGSSLSGAVELSGGSEPTRNRTTSNAGRNDTRGRRRPETAIHRAPSASSRNLGYRGGTPDRSLSSTASNARRFERDLRRGTSNAGQKRRREHQDDRHSKVPRESRYQDAASSRRPSYRPSVYDLNVYNCKVGSVIQAVIYEEVIDQNIISRMEQGYTHPDVLPTQDGWYIRKHRPWIVTAVFADSYQYIPVHTHNGTGLEGRRNKPELLREYVAVQDNKPGDSSETAGQRKPLVIGEQYNDFKNKKNSFAWLTYSVSRRRRMKARIVGKLGHESVENLMEMLAKFAPSAQPLVENSWDPAAADLDPPRSPRYTQALGELY